MTKNTFTRKQDEVRARSLSLFPMFYTDYMSVLGPNWGINVLGLPLCPVSTEQKHMG